MKSILILFVFLVEARLLDAQIPVAQDNQLTIASPPNPRGYSGSLFLRHYIKNNYAIRYGTAWSYNYTRSSLADQYATFDHTITESTIENFSASIGLQKSFHSFSDRFEPYIAFDLVFSNYFTSSLSKDVEIYHPSLFYYYAHTFSYTLNKYSLLGVALRPAIGANYYFNNNFSVGIEYRINTLISETYFSKKEISDNINSTGVTTTHFPKVFTSATNFNGSFLITISYKFNKKS